jgi:hypothetical protein
MEWIKLLVRTTHLGLGTVVNRKTQWCFFLLATITLLPYSNQSYAQSTAALHVTACAVNSVRLYFINKLYIVCMNNSL